MPFIELPTAQPTGLAQLGSALAGAGHDYMDQKLAQSRFDQQRANQLQDIGTARANQLQDIASQRNYSDTVRTTEHQNALDLNSAENQQQIQRGAISLLIDHGYLSPDDVNDPQALHDAFQKSQQDGLYQRYHDMLYSVNPKTGKPFLTPQQMGDPQAVQQAYTDFGQFQADQGMIGLHNAMDAKSAATKAQLQLQHIQAQKDLLAQQANRLQAQATPTDAEVNAQALVLAQQSLKPGELPSTAQVAAQRDAAYQTIAQRKSALIAEARTPLDQQRRNLDASENRLTQQLDEFAKKSIYPDNSQLTEPDDGSDTPPVAPPAADPRAVGQSILSGLVQPTPGAAAPGPAAANLLTDPTGSDPIIAAENQRRQQASFQANVLAPLQQKQAELAQIDQQIAAAKTGANPTPLPAGGPQAAPGVSFSPYPGMSGMSGAQPNNQLDPSGQASVLSDLYQRRQAVAATLAQLQQQSAQQPGIPGGVPTLAGTTPPASGAPLPQTGSQLSNPSFSDFNGSTPSAATGAPSMMDLYGSGQSYLNQ